MELCAKIETKAHQQIHKNTGIQLCKTYEPKKKYGHTKPSILKIHLIHEKFNDRAAYSMTLNRR